MRLAFTMYEMPFFEELFLNSSLRHCYAYLIFNGERAFCNSFVSLWPILNFCMPDIQ